LKKLGKDIAIYGVTNTIYALVQFITMPLVVKGMNMEDIANWNILLPTGVLLSSITTFGMDSSVVRYIADTDSHAEHRKIFSTGFIVIFLLSILAGIFLYLFTSGAMSQMHLPESQTHSYWLMLAWFIGLVVNQYCLNWLKYTFRRKPFIILMFLQSIVYLIIILAFIYSRKLTVANVMWALVISQWFNALIFILIQRKMFVLYLGSDLLKKLFVYGLPSMLIVFGMNLVLSLDRYVLTGHLTKEQFAIYTQAIRICAIVSMLVSSFNFAFLPTSMSIINSEDAGATFSRIHSYYLLIMTFFGLAFIACGKLAILILSGAEYLPAYQYFPLMVLAFILYGLYSFAQIGIIKSKKIVYGLYVVMGGIVTAYIVDVLLVNPLGGFGTAIGFVVALIIMLFMANKISKKDIVIPYAMKKDMVIGAYFIGLAVLFCYVDFSRNIYWDSFIKVLLLIITIIPIILTFFREEKTFVLSVLSQRMKLKRSAHRV
jgi:O-antigen/teichoic acid export membrane protein